MLKRRVSIVLLITVCLLLPLTGMAADGTDDTTLTEKFSIPQVPGNDGNEIVIEGIFLIDEYWNSNPTEDEVSDFSYDEETHTYSAETDIKKPWIMVELSNGSYNAELTLIDVKQDKIIGWRHFANRHLEGGIRIVGTRVTVNGKHKEYSLAITSRDGMESEEYKLIIN